MLKNELTIAAKCAPSKELLTIIKDSGIKAVELYLDAEMMKEPLGIIKLCDLFPLRYAIHSPNDGYDPRDMEKLANDLDAGVVVAHNTLWEDEWQKAAEVFKGSDVKLCIENTVSAHEPLKFMRRYGFGMCLDLEHIQMECCGVYEQAVLNIMKMANHIHMTGYTHGSHLWHTPAHHAPLHNKYLLDLLDSTGYNGLVVSEADTRYQTAEEFANLARFFAEWQSDRDARREQSSQ